jgi:NodT family efflux transporter outer membrane factor (OMF) lipoprotein
VKRAAAVLLALVAVAGCATAPKYVRPETAAPPSFAEAGEWKTARPNDEVLRGKWWEIFHDERLNALEDRIDVGNNTLQAAQAQFDQARALLRYTAAARSPQVSGTAVATRTNHSESTPNWSSTAAEHYSDYLLRIDAAYEVDVWGRVRSSIAASRASAQASAGDLEAVRLSLHAELAADYFALRATDAERDLLASSVAAYEKALELTENRHRGGVATAVDVAQAQAQLETTRAQLVDLESRRAPLEHALATLIGQAPGSVKPDYAPLVERPPAIPPGLPAHLLERRPDVAAAERRVAAANAQIGVARSLFYPAIALTATTGFESSALVNLVKGVSGFWTAAPVAAMTLIDGGRRRAVSAQAKAGYDQAVALYRATTLTALGEVEDQLATLRVLEHEATAQQAAVAAADRSLELSNNRYKGGIATYLEVIVAQNAALTNRRVAVSILARQLTASVLLIKALGGGWDAARLPAF